MKRTGRPCTVCDHPQRHEVDQALLDPRSAMPALSKRFGLSVPALLRHRHGHLPKAAKQAAAEALSAAEGYRAASLVEQAAKLRDRALVLLDEAEATGDRIATARAIREVRETIVAIGRLTGEVRDQQTTIVNFAAILTDPGWTALQAAIVAALTTHPEAKRAVLQAIEHLAA